MKNHHVSQRGIDEKITLKVEAGLKKVTGEVEAGLVKLRSPAINSQTTI